MDKIKSALTKIARESLKESFDGIEESKENLNEALGVAIARYCDWTSRDILEVCFGALEDANYHIEAQLLQEAFEKRWVKDQQDYHGKV